MKIVPARPRASSPRVCTLPCAAARWLVHTAVRRRVLEAALAGGLPPLLAPRLAYLTAPVLAYGYATAAAARMARPAQRSAQAPAAPPAVCRRGVIRGGQRVVRPLCQASPARGGGAPSRVGRARPLRSRTLARLVSQPSSRQRGVHSSTIITQHIPPHMPQSGHKTAARS